MKLVLNHLTRMQSGYICVAGVDVQAKRHVRPIPARAHLRPELLACHGGPFDLGVILDLGPTKYIGQPPQVEDHEFDLRQAKALGTLAAPRFWNMLTQMAQPSLRAIFGADLQKRGTNSCGVDVGKGSASLGCLIPQAAPDIYLRSRPEKPDQIRMRVTDGDFVLDLGVTDIRLYAADHAAPERSAVQAVQERLRRKEEVILGVGLTRPFSPSPELVSPLHWVQVNNLHFKADPLWPCKNVNSRASQKEGPS